jgi:hypothetical protein
MSLLKESIECSTPVRQTFRCMLHNGLVPESLLVCGQARLFGVAGDASYFNV